MGNRYNPRVGVAAFSLEEDVSTIGIYYYVESTVGNYTLTEHQILYLPLTDKKEQFYSIIDTNPEIISWPNGYHTDAVTLKASDVPNIDYWLSQQNHYYASSKNEKEEVTQEGFIKLDLE
jgi:hypothetical protein